MKPAPTPAPWDATAFFIPLCGLAMPWCFPHRARPVPRYGAGIHVPGPWIPAQGRNDDTRAAFSSCVAGVAIPVIDPERRCYPPMSFRTQRSMVRNLKTQDRKTRYGV